MKPETIPGYHAAQSAGDKALCDRLYCIISGHLPEADAKMWHAHPVWFLGANPIVGYSTLKSCVRCMFWSGQSFAAPGLTPTGTFKAAAVRYTQADQVDEAMLAACLADSRRIQWDYANITKRKGRLDPLMGL